VVLKNTNKKTRVLYEYFSIVSANPDAFDASSGDLLTIVELDALQTMAALQVLEGHISYKGTVVQFNHCEALLATGAAAQSSDAIICDQLTVGQGLPGEQGTELVTHKINGFSNTWT